MATDIRSELVFDVLRDWGWTVEIDDSGDTLPIVPARCDPDSKVIWVNGSANCMDQVTAAVYLSCWPDQGIVNLCSDSRYHSIQKFRFPSVENVLKSIYAGATAAFRLKGRVHNGN